MTAAITLNKERLQRTSGLPAEPALRWATTFLADLVKPGASVPPGEFDADRVSGTFDDPEAADGWARRFYESWVEELSPEEYSTSTRRKDSAA